MRGARTPLCVVGLLLTLSLQSHAYGTEATTTVATRSGPVTGRSDGQVIHYLGIPYARPPVGDGRWRPPQPPTPWRTPYAATHYGPICPQNLRIINPPRPEVSEDCLTLNVWTPRGRGSKPYPVIVWLHGGGYFLGSASQWPTDGGYLAGLGAVVVSVNFRLGALGFLAHPELSKEDHGHSGNYGILDQILALHWVQDNIRAFGGDPGNVTLFGQSSGSVTITTLMSSPLGRNLFHKAILHSGGAPPRLRHLNKTLHGLDSMEAFGVRFADTLGIAEDHANPIEPLRAVSWQNAVQAWEDTLRAQGAAGEGTLNHLILDDRVLKDPPGAVFRRGAQQKVPMLTGVVADEGSWFAQRSGLADDPRYRRYLTKVYGPELGPKLHNLYTPERYGGAESAASALIRDLFFVTLRHTADWMAAVEPDTYVYYFQRTGKHTGAQAELGDFHSAELPYVFHQLPPQLASSKKDQALADEMAARWIAFARSGTPNDDSERLPWPRYTLEHPRYLHLGYESQIGENLGGSALNALERTLWPPVSPLGESSSRTP